jgi:hypothetical protein
MSQAHVEQIIGRLATDERWRSRFRRGRADAIDALAAAAGFEITTTERRALLALPPESLDQFAGTIDPKLQRLAVPS